MSVQSDDSLKIPNQPDQAPDGAQPESADDLDKVRAELAEIEQKADEYLRLAQRTQADFINYRRRVDEERAQQARDASVNFLQRLLPILDDFERAFANAAPEDLESSWAKGVQLDRKSTRLNSSHGLLSRMPSSA